MDNVRVDSQKTCNVTTEHGFGHVWECGDEYCNCSEAKITLRRKNEHKEHLWPQGAEVQRYCCGIEAVETTTAPDHDPVNHPSHYTAHPSGVECIEITRHMNFNLGNVVKYVWRAGQKDEAPTLQDLKKAAWYLNDEIERREKDEE